MDAKSPVGSGSVPPYLVRRIENDPAAEAEGHDHVTAIETLDPDGGETRWSLVQVIAAVRDGERFVMAAGEKDAGSNLEPTVCPRCEHATLTLAPSIDRDNPA